MNSIFFLIPFMLIASVGIYHDVYAFNVTVGYDYFDIVNPDGTHTWKSHEPYILDNGVYVPYVQNGLTMQSAIGTVTLNVDGSYTWNGKFDDRIIGKYADISDLTSWAYLNTLNNDVPDLSFINDEFHSNKVKAGVGDMDYKYVFNNGKWKTELVVTNLSGLSTKVFGFDQIIDLHSDTIKFGGITRNLDNFDGVTFDKEFLDANEGKVLDLLNGVNFDFDLGYDNLYSVTIHDTGVNSSQLVFDYRTDTVLLPGETLIIDPTFNSATSTDGRLLATGGTGSVCTSYSSADTDRYAATKDSPNAGSPSCQVAYFQYDLSSIDPSATIDSAYFEYDTILTSSTGRPCMVVISSTNTVGSQMYADGAFTAGFAGTNATTPTTTCQTVANGHQENLLSSSFSAIESKFGGTTTILMTSAQIPRDANNNYVQFRDNDAVLNIVYSTPPPPDAVDDLSSPSQTYGSVDLLWTQPELNGGNLTGYQINYTTPYGTPTTIITNNTESTTTGTTVSNLEIGTPYSFRIGVWTESYNATGNILNVTTSGNFTIGTSVFNQTNTQILPITFEQQSVNATTKLLNVTFANTYDLACDFHYKFANTNQTYTNLTSNAVSSTLNETSFEFVDYDNEVIGVYCYDTVTGTDGKYILTQSDFPLLQQIQSFRDGEYGTSGDFGVFDFVTLLVVIISMIGLNRLNESVGAIFNIIFLGSLAYFGIIELPTVIFGALAVVLIFVITSTRKT